MVFVNLGRLRVLVIASHPDDTELGCGGFIFRLIHECRAQVDLLILTPGLRHWEPGRAFEQESRVREARQAAEVLGIPQGRVEILPFRDCHLHLYLHELIEEIERRLVEASGDRRYDLVLTHAGADTHADHRTACDATLAAARSYQGAILLYQSVSTTPNGFRPTYFVSLDDAAIATKQQALDCHESQRGKEFMQPVRTEGMAQGWAAFLRHPGAFLEAFEVAKVFWWTRSSEAAACVA